MSELESTNGTEISELPEEQLDNDMDETSVNENDNEEEEQDKKPPLRWFVFF